MAKQRTTLPLLDFLYSSKALADESRIRILMALEDHELCVCQIVELLGLAPSTVSKHLSILRQAGLVESRKSGRWIFYKQAAPQEDEISTRGLQWLSASLHEDPVIRENRERLKEIIRIPPEELCRTEDLN